MNLSYWEYKTWLSNVDFTVVGSGIVGLNCALQLRKNNPKAKILVIEKGILPQGASTKNAGFACFGSISELLSDLKNHSEEELLQLVVQRWHGIQALRTTLGDSVLDYRLHGGHELFLEEDSTMYEKCVSQIPYINQLLYPVFEGDVFSITPNRFKFNGIGQYYISHNYEAQIDTGKMMNGLLQKAYANEIIIINGVTVNSFEDLAQRVAIETDAFSFSSNKLCIATNGFARNIVKAKVIPARAQVVITKPIENLAIKGTFHLNEGYYYFRNIDNRILLGGGRNLDFKTEETTEFGTTQLVTNTLEKLMGDVILPNTSFEIERTWSGIMGVGDKKNPIVKRISNNVVCGVRLGGMGVAIGAEVGVQMADLM